MKYKSSNTKIVEHTINLTN